MAMTPAATDQQNELRIYASHLDQHIDIRDNWECTWVAGAASFVGQAILLRSAIQHQLMPTIKQEVPS